MEASELECCLTVEHLNSNGVVTKRRTYKSITVVLGRDEFRDIALRIVSSQSPLGKTFLLKELTIHKRFLQEGKATIKLLTQKIQIMFSNCPPNQLAAFLKCLSLKLAQSKQNGIASNRRRLLSDKVRSAKLQNTPQLISASLTCVGRLWRSRHNTIDAILIQWHVNELRGILKLLRAVVWKHKPSYRQRFHSGPQEKASGR